MEGAPNQSAEAGLSGGTAEAVAIVDGLARLFAAAAIYPSTHVRVATLAGPVLERVSAGCGNDRALAIEVRPEGLAVGGAPLPGSHAAAARLRADLASVGVLRLEIARTATVEDLVQLGRVLRTHAQSRNGTASFRHLELTGLPESVRAIHHDFGAPTFDESETAVQDEDAFDLDLLSRALEQRAAEEVSAAPPAGGGQGSSAGRRNGASSGSQREAENGAVAHPASDGERGASAEPGAHPHGDADAITALLQSVIERATREAASASDPADARVPQGRREILRSIAESLHRAVQRTGGIASQGVAGVLEEFREALPRIAPRVSPGKLLEMLQHEIDVHLRDAFRREALSSFGAAVGGRTRDPVGKEDLLQALVTRLGELGADGEPFQAPGDDRPTEHLGILLHTLTTTPAGPFRDVVAGRLASELEGAADEAQALVLRGWFFDLVCRDDAAEVDAVLPLVLWPLRSHGANAVIDLLLSALRPPTPESLHLLWPYLVDAVLRISDGSTQEQEEEIIGLLALLDATDLLSETDRLLSMPSVKSGVLSRRLLSPPRPNLYGLYEVFLNARRAPHLGIHVLEAFFRTPPSTPASGVLSVLRPSEERSRAFVGRLLRENHGAGESPALRRLASDTLVEALRTCPLPRRGEPWVLKAVIALRQLPSPERDATLRQIVAERRFGIVSAWPSSVRAAAKSIAAGGLPPPPNGAARHDDARPAPEFFGDDADGRRSHGRASPAPEKSPPAIGRVA